MTRSDENLWIVTRCPNPRADIRLFCLPYAGAGPNVFDGWHDLAANVEVCTISLPGRGRRFRERPYECLISLVQDIATSACRLLDRRFALFGHSMGALAAFELARIWRATWGREPVILCVSGCRPPHLPDPYQFHTLPDDAFRQKIRTLNGIHPEILRNGELMELLLPVLRADFALSETYLCAEDEPLGCPMSIFGGRFDPHVTGDMLEAWRIHTTAESHVDILPGDHFFLHSAESQLLGILSRRLFNPAGTTPSVPKTSVTE